MAIIGKGNTRPNDIDSSGSKELNRKIDAEIPIDLANHLIAPVSNEEADEREKRQEVNQQQAMTNFMALQAQQAIADRGDMQSPMRSAFGEDISRATIMSDALARSGQEAMANLQAENRVSPFTSKDDALPPEMTSTGYVDSSTGEIVEHANELDGNVFSENDAVEDSEKRDKSKKENKENTEKDKKSAESKQTRPSEVSVDDVDKQRKREDHEEFLRGKTGRDVLGPDVLDPFFKDSSYLGFSKDEKKSMKDNVSDLYKNRSMDDRLRDEFPNRTSTLRDESTTFDDMSSQQARDSMTDVTNAPGGKREFQELENRRAQDQTREMFMESRLHVEGEWIDDKRRLRFGSIAEPALLSVMKYYSMSMTDSIRLVMLRLGIGVDKQGKVFDEDWRDATITEEQLSTACAMILESQRIHGHPLGLLPTEPLIIAKSERFPVGVIPISLARAMVGMPTSQLRKNLGPLDGDALEALARDLQSRTREYFVDNVRPEIARKTVNNPAQRLALDNMVRALAGLDGDSSTLYGVSEQIDRDVEHILDSCIDEETLDPSNADVAKARQERVKEAGKRARKEYRRERRTKDKDGNITYEYSPKHTFIGNALMSWAGWARFAGVAGDIPLMISNGLEHFLGNIATLESNFILSRFVPSAYRMTSGLKGIARSKEMKDSMDAYKLIMSVGDADLATLFAVEVKNGRLPSTREAANKFLDEWINGERSVADPSKTASIREKAKHASRNIVNTLMPGDMGFKGSDNINFLTMFLIGMGESNSAMTAAELESAFATNDPGKVLADLILTPQGMNAVVAMRNQTTGRINPISAQVNRLMRKNGVTNFLITVGLNTYVDYGISWAQVMFPLSNTFSYLATRGLTKDGSGIRQYQLGGNDEFQRGLVKNFVYDAVRLGNIGAIACLAYCLIEALKFDDPDDKEAIWNWDEYKIGGETWRTAWWMNDLVGWGLPLAVAMHVAKKHPEDPVRAQQVFLDGVYDMVSGTSIMDACEFVTNAKDNAQMMQDMATIPGYSPAKDVTSWTTKQLAWFMQAVVKKSTPRVARTWYKDTFFVGTEARDHSANYVRTGTKSDDGYDDVEYLTDENEIQDRMWAKSNPLYGLYLNMMRNHYLFDDGTTDKTGYLFWEMPVSTMKDPARAAFADQYDFDPSDPNSVPVDKEERQEFLEKKAEELIADIAKYESPEQAIANHFMIPYNARKNAIEYCYAQILKTKLELVENRRAGMYQDFDSDYEAGVRASEQQSYYYDLLDKWFKNDDIPWSDEGYEKLLTDYQVYYTWKDSGERANPWEAMVFGDAIERRYEPYGNHPTSWAIATNVDREGRGYNAETINDWFVDGLTDTEQILEDSKGVAVPRGRDAGNDLSGVLFGGTYDRPGDMTGLPDGYNIPAKGEPTTIGHRGYVAREGNLPESLANIDEKSIADLMGIDLDDLNDSVKNNPNKTNYNAWKRYGGGGGGGSYAPKIYSNPRSVSADRAASMYTKSPYNATTTYLRPGFYTKGSREAYRRQDM